MRLHPADAQGRSAAMTSLEEKDAMGSSGNSTPHEAGKGESRLRWDWLMSKTLSSEEADRSVVWEESRTVWAGLRGLTAMLRSRANSPSNGVTGSVFLPICSWEAELEKWLFNLPRGGGVKTSASSSRGWVAGTLTTSMSFPSWLEIWGEEASEVTGSEKTPPPHINMACCWNCSRRLASHSSARLLVLENRRQPTKCPDVADSSCENNIIGVRGLAFSQAAVWAKESRRGDGARPGKVWSEYTCRLLQKDTDGRNKKKVKAGWWQIKRPVG